jgi:hypothetical protein
MAQAGKGNGHAENPYEWSDDSKAAKQDSSWECCSSRWPKTYHECPCCEAKQPGINAQ